MMNTRMHVAGIAVLITAFSSTAVAQQLRPDDPDYPPHQPPANVELTLSDLDTDQGILQVCASNGVCFGIDEPLGRAYLTNSHGTFDVSLNAVLLEAANGNPNVAAAMRAQLHDDLTAEGKSSRITKRGWTGLVAPSLGTSMTDDPVANIYDGDGWLPRFRCTPPEVCQEANVRISNWGTYNMQFSGETTYCEAHPGDCGDWEVYRRGHCDQMSDNVWSGIISEVGMLSCFAAEFAPAAAGCIASIAGYFHALTSYLDNTEICLSNYPGPGNW